MKTHDNMESINTGMVSLLETRQKDTIQDIITLSESKGRTDAIVELKEFVESYKRDCVYKYNEMYGTGFSMALDFVAEKLEEMRAENEKRD